MNAMKISSKLRILLIAVLTLSLVACTQDQITTTLEAAVNAAIAADSIARPQDQPYLTLATGCLDSAESILSGTSTPVIKGTQIAAACASAIAAGAGAPVDVQAVAAALNTFLQAVTVTQAQLSQPVPFSNSFMGSGGGAANAKLDKRALGKIRKKLDQLKARRAAGK